MSRSDAQVWADYQREAAAYREKEFGIDPLNQNPDYLLGKAMQLLAKQPRAIFVGQGVVYGGHAMAKHLDGVLAEQRIEFPVAEELQLGFCTGLAMEGWLPVAIFPRIDFILRAMDQLANHLDLIKEMSQEQWNPKVIVRTRVGSKTPLDAGPQHTKNYSHWFDEILQNVDVVEIRRPDRIMSGYREALDLSRSVIVVENLG